jgi:4-amino-4-deoxychorismate lyase
VESALREGGRDPDLRLIETLAWDGTALVRPEEHLARLAHAAMLLGWPCDPGRARAALLADRRAPARLRLTLDRLGGIDVTSGPLPAIPDVWRLGLAPERLASDDPWLRVKTTRRAAYDRARAHLPEGIDEVLFQNERGEVCDGTIISVFFDAGQGLCTPPLASGLLPGVLRGALIAQGRVREEILFARDLPDVRLWVGNSVRGLIPAIWAHPFSPADRPL